MKKIAMIMLTCDRLKYTRLAVASVLKNDIDFTLHIVDNGSRETGMRDFLGSIADPRVNVKFNESNKGITGAVNEFWLGTDADVVGKIDNDIIIHEDGIASLYRYMELPQYCIVSGRREGHEFVGNNGEGVQVSEFCGLQGVVSLFVPGGFYLMNHEIIEKYGVVPTRYETSRILGWTDYQQLITKFGANILYGFPVVPFLHLPEGVNDSEETGFKEYYFKNFVSRRGKNIACTVDCIPDGFARLGSTPLLKETARKCKDDPDGLIQYTKKIAIELGINIDL